jgi:hypothetical protein
MAFALYIYIDNEDGVPVSHRLELFADESVSVVSSVQNFRDLGKVFTDYTKSFTIPASTHNNKILKHWYNSEVGATSIDNPLSVDGAFDHRISYYARIEIDTIPFRYGKLLLKGSKKVNNKIESYIVEFVGNLVQLKERFKDDKLKDLAYFDDGVRISYYDQLNHAWSLSEVQDRVQTPDSTVCYPLIGSRRKFFLDSGTASQDISETAGRLLFNELFPALKVSTILGYIQDCYGITFEGAFISSQTFSKLYLYLKNQEEFAIKPEQLRIDFTSKSANTRIEDLFGDLIDTATGAGFNDMNLDTDTLVFDNDFINQFFDPPSTPIGYTPSISYRRKVLLEITTASSNSYDLYIYNNGVLFSSFIGRVGTQTFNIIDTIILQNITPIYNFTFFISSEAGISFTSELKQIITRRGNFNPGPFSGGFVGVYSEYQVSTATSPSQTTVSNIDIKSFVPDITVEKFVEGLIKMFNIMVIPTSETSFYLQPLNDYYADGRTIDITKYTTVDDISIDPPQLYKRIEFKYQKSDNILNEAFRGLFNKEYGDLSFENKNSAFSETYSVELPFENFMFERETGTDFITATVFNKDSQPYVPKPTLIYNNGLQTVDPDIKISDTVTTNDIGNYVRFSNELPLAATDLTYVQSLNWGAEISAWDLNINFIGLYEKFYSDYIENLFNQRTRVVKVKAILPTSLLTSISLRDKIIVSNKRYIINTMTPELTTGETTFELILDNSNAQSLADNEVLRLSNLQEVNIDNTAQRIELQIFLKDNDLWRGKNAVGFLVGSYTFGVNTYKDGLLIVDVPANGTAANRSDYVIVEYFKGLDSFEIKIKINQYA